MPTDRPRHTITESDEVARALDAAADRWPEDSAARARLLTRLVKEGHRALEAQAGADAARRRRAVEETAGALTGVYPAGYLADLRRDWPE